MSYSHPEKPELKLGFIPLTDCAPLAVAEAQGFFRDEGLAVTLCREVSWANIRDKVMLGALDAAQMPAPMPLAATLGVAGPRLPMLAACVLNLGGNAITVSRELYRQMRALAPADAEARPASAAALRMVIDARRADNLPPLRFATVFPTSTHHYQLRYWLRSAGIDPDRDLQLLVVSPPHMVQALERDEIAGFCVGEPWNSLAVQRELGVSLISSYEIWNNAMEKVLGVTAAWAARHPRTLQALIRAVVRAGQWLETNPVATAALLARPQYVNLSEELLLAALCGERWCAGNEPPLQLPDFLVFHRYAANFPWRSQGKWYGEQMRLAGQLNATAELEPAVSQTYRSDLYREAVRPLGLAVPTVDAKREGEHSVGWTLTEATAPLAMGADRFFGGDNVVQPAVMTGGLIST